MSQREIILRCILLPLIFLAHAPHAKAQTNPEGAQAPRLEHMDQAGALHEQVRAACIQGRRRICGRILRVLPTGLVIESGYTSLLRTNFQSSWVIPGTVVASREPNLVETPQPDSVCVGTIFLTDLPRHRGAKVKPYDYVVLTAYPAGQYTYNSVGTIQHTVRRFSGGLETAVRLTLESDEKTNGGPATNVQPVPPDRTGK